MNRNSLITGVALSALLAGSAMAQDTATDPMANDPTTGAETQPMTTEGGMATDTAADPAMTAPAYTSIEEMTVGDVIGMKTYDPEGNDIAEIDYVVMSGDELSGVLGIGGFLGLGEYTVALPLADFELNEDGTGFILGTDKETLKDRPEFDESGVESLPDDMLIGDLMTDTESDTSGSMTTETPAADSPVIPDAPAADEEMSEEPAADEQMSEEPATDEQMADEPADSETAEPADDSATMAPADEAETDTETETEQNN